MQCSKWDEFMSLHLDGLLGTEQQQQLQAHLAGCQTCREQWAALSWLSVRLASEPAVAPAFDLAARVTARLEQRETRRRRLSGTIGLCVASVGLWTVAALAVLLLFAVLVDPSLHTVLADMAVSLGRNALAFVTVLGKALRTVVYAVVTRPAGLLILGYAVLAVALVGFWTRVVLRRWGHVAQ